MSLALLIGLFGGICAVFAVRFFESLRKDTETSFIDGIEIIEDDVLG